MTPDILIVRDSTGYRLLHGYLHLTNSLNMEREIFVDVRGVGKAKVERNDGRILVNSETLTCSLLSAY